MKNRAIGNRGRFGYRHGLEVPVLLGTLVAGGIILLMSGVFSAGTLAAVFLFLIIINYFRNRSVFARYIRSSVKVEENNFPQLKRLFDECLEYVDAPSDTECYILPADILNAFALGFRKPYKILLASPLLEHFDRDELKSIIGHELGHIRYGHTFWALITGAFENQSYGVFGIGMLIRFMFLFHSRLCEYTADRAGLVACGNLNKAISAELKLHLSPGEVKREMQAIALRGDIADDSLSEDLLELTATHPTMKGRIRQIIAFARSEKYWSVRPGDPDVHPEGSRSTRSGAH